MKEKDTLEKRKQSSKELLALRVDNFVKRASWQVDAEFFEILAKDAFEVGFAALRLAEVVHVKWRYEKEEVGG